MKTKSLIIIAGLVLLAVGIVACGSTEAAEETTPVVATTIQQPNTVSAEAFVVPLQEANLSFEINGRVVSVEVEEGDTISAGDTLVQLDGSSIQAQKIEAEAGRANAQANLTQAQAALSQAEATLADTKAGATPEQIAQAEASVAQAEAALAEILAGPTKEDIAQAEAAVETARASLANVLAGSRDEDLQAASSRLLQAEADVRLKQADYDKFVYGEPQVAEPYGVALQQSTLNYEAAQAEYNKLLNGATDEEVAIARAQLNEAQAALAKTKAGATPEQIAQAQAGVVQVQAALAELKAGATAEKVTVAEAGVQSAEAGIGIAEAGIESAEAGLQSVETELGKTELKAPFDGVVGSLNVETGEIVQPGEVSVIVGDNSIWQIETDDLTEIDVVRVRPGRKVTISVDALPNDEFEGEVIRIKPKSETKAGDVTYTVLIDITSGPTEKLQWGMTTFVDIEAGPDL
jgi:multidrug resistance efflux pump